MGHSGKPLRLFALPCATCTAIFILLFCLLTSGSVPATAQTVAPLNPGNPSAVSPPAAPDGAIASENVLKDLSLGHSLLASNNLAGSLEPLKRAADSCDASSLKSQSCAEAYNWYGLALRASDRRNPEILRSRVEPLYRKALAITEDGPMDETSATALELEGLALKELGDETGSKALLDRAFPIRAHIVESMSPLRAASAPPGEPGSAGGSTGGGTTPPTVFSKVDPGYNELARLALVSGGVMLSIVVEPQGYASTFKLVKSLGLGLDEEAVKALRAWRFRPGLNGGTAVRVKTQIEVNFRLL